MSSLLLKNVVLWKTNVDQSAACCDIRIDQGRIAAIGPSLGGMADRVIDGGGRIAAPGLVDMHVHLRDPGQTYKEDIFSGCRAAAAGGVTTVAAMPNTLPACDTPQTVRYVRQQGEAAAVRVLPVGAITKGLLGETLTDFGALKAAGAVALSDDGRPVADRQQMAQAMRQAATLGLPILSHCEELSLVRGGVMNEGEVSRSLGVPGISREAENTATAREIALCEETRCFVHICHVSTKESVEMLRKARRKGLPVSAETAPHYFALTDECLRTKDADYRMNPPLRTKEDRQAVIAALVDGTIPIIATDHAPHTPEEKSDFLRAPNGVIGLETSLAAGITFLVCPGFLSLEELIERMAGAPARLLGQPGGDLVPGGPGDLVLFDPDEAFLVGGDARTGGRPFHGKTRNSAFKGMTLYGRVKLTLCRGAVVYEE